ncbi:nicotinamide-nucleotide amidase, partial [Yersinia pestis subsp. pestis]|nr:nicotinamide-nucleotide amidase [Yersinia pestis subsp. pestis]
MSEGQLRQLSIAVGHKLKEHGAWVTCAESC